MSDVEGSTERGRKSVNPGRALPCPTTHTPRFLFATIQSQAQTSEIRPVTFFSLLTSGQTVPPHPYPLLQFPWRLFFSTRKGRRKIVSKWLMQLGMRKPCDYLYSLFNQKVIFHSPLSCSSISYSVKYYI